MDVSHIFEAKDQDDLEERVIQECRKHLFTKKDILLFMNQSIRFYEERITCTRERWSDMNYETD